MNILILGGTSEIARQFCYHYLNDSNIYITARDTSLLEPLKKDIELRGTSKVNILAYDVQKPELLDGIRAISDNIQLLLVTIGYLGDQEKAENDIQEALKTIDINFRNLLPAIDLVASGMVRKKAGTIVGISSVAGERGRGSNYYYGAAKAAFTAYLSGLRNRLFKSNVHVLTVLPGFIDTKMTSHLTLPKPLTASPKQVADKIFIAANKKKNVVYVLPIWKWIMTIIKNIPEAIFKKLKL